MAVNYRLFAAPVSAETVRRAADERFSRITAEYILIYRKTKPKDLPCAEIKGADTEHLTERDRAWLKDSILVLLAEAAAKAQEKSKERMNELMDNLEDALREEQEKLNEGTENGGKTESDN